MSWYLYLFTPPKLRFPFWEADLEDMAIQSPSFPPTTWDRYDPYQWPLWRRELWHEVCHQVEHCRFNSFDPRRNQLPGDHDWPEWNNAVAHMAAKFGTATELLRAVL